MQENKNANERDKEKKPKIRVRRRKTQEKVIHIPQIKNIKLFQNNQNKEPHLQYK